MPRGRSYPAIGLSEAIERARDLYAQDDRALTSPGAAVGAWGYSSLNGASLRVLSALRQYGLLAGVGDQIKLSDRALAILLEPEDSQERADAIAEAAKAPAIFREILEAHDPDGLPGDVGLRSFLIRNDAFGFKQEASDKLIASLRETLALANDTKRSYSTPSNRALDADSDADNDQSDTHREQPPKHRPRAPMQQVSGSEPKVQELTIPLRGGGMAVLSIPVPMTRQNYKKLQGWLTWAEDMLVLEDDASTDPPTNGGDDATAE